MSKIVHSYHNSHIIYKRITNEAKENRKNEKMLSIFVGISAIVVVVFELILSYSF